MQYGQTIHSFLTEGQTKVLLVSLTYYLIDFFNEAALELEKRPVVALYVDAKPDPKG